MRAEAVAHNLLEFFSACETNIRDANDSFDRIKRMVTGGTFELEELGSLVGTLTASWQKLAEASEHRRCPAQLAAAATGTEEKTRQVAKMLADNCLSNVADVIKALKACSDNPDPAEEVPAPGVVHIEGVLPILNNPRLLKVAGLSSSVKWLENIVVQAPVLLSGAGLLPGPQHGVGSLVAW